jgi:hypothetical protein
MRIVWPAVLAIGCADHVTETMSCPQSIAAYCSENIHICPTWTQAQDPHTWGCDGTLVLEHCGDRMVASIAGTDTSDDFTYSADGTLIAVSHYNANSHDVTCTAGTLEVDPCVDPNPQRITLCPP